MNVDVCDHDIHGQWLDRGSSLRLRCGDRSFYSRMRPSALLGTAFIRKNPPFFLERLSALLSFCHLFFANWRWWLILGVFFTFKRNIQRLILMSEKRSATFFSIDLWILGDLGLEILLGSL